MPNYHLSDGDVLIHTDGECEMIFNVTIGTIFDEHGLVCGSFDALPTSYLDACIKFEDGWNVLDLSMDEPGLW